jgi:hypothetical protein
MLRRETLICKIFAFTLFFVLILVVVGYEFLRLILRV